MIRFFAAALLATATVALAQTTPCPAPFTGTAIPIVVTSMPASTLSTVPVSIQSATSGTGQPLTPTPVVLPGPASPNVAPSAGAVIISSTIPASTPVIQSAQVVIPGTLGTVLSQLPAGAIGTVIYADSSIASTASLGNATNIVAAQLNSGSSPTAQVAGASVSAAPVITGFSPSGSQGSCSFFQIAGQGFGSTTPPTVLLVAFAPICYMDDDGVDVVACPLYDSSMYWAENEVPATLVNATDTLITVALSQPLAGTRSLGIVVTNNADNETGNFCAVLSDYDDNQCVASQYVNGSLQPAGGN